VIVTAYLDESGTHDGSPVMVMAAVMGTAAQWGRYQTGLDRLRKMYGFKIFHAKEVRSGRGEFAGWSREKRLALIGGMTDLCAQTTMHALVFSVRRSEYQAEYRLSDGPRKMRLDTEYALAFRMCLVNMIGYLLGQGWPPKKLDRTRLNVVLESGHSNAGDAARVFDEEMRDMKDLGWDVLAGITFADKKKCDPLMGADFLAYTRFTRGEDHVPELPEEALARGKRREKSTLMHHDFEPGGVAKYKTWLVDQWRTKRGQSPSVPAERSESPA